MRHPILKTIGFGLAGLVFAGIALNVAMAIRNGEGFVGRNAYGLLIPVYPTVAIFIVAGLAGVV